MRGTAAGFRLDAGSFLTDPRTAAFSPADLGGLVLLLCHAWEAGGEVPADPDSLAALSRLGAGWASSRLASALHLFFRPAGDRLVSTDLVPQLRHRAEVSAAKAAAGRASGRARRTSVEHMFDICSTDVQRVLEGAGGPEEASREGVQPSETRPEAPGTVKCSISTPPAGGCAPPPGPEPRNRPGGFSFPPHTPLYREDSFSSLSRGGGAGEGGAENAAPAPVDLFGTPIRPKGRPRRARPTKEQVDAAVLIVDAYMDEVGPEESRTARADANVAKWLADGASADDLRAAVRHYARLCDRSNRDPQYRKAAHNFFGRESAFWRAYIKEPNHDAAKPNAGPAGRVRTGKSYEGIGVTVSNRPDDPPAPEALPLGEGAEHRPNPFRA